jgi:quinolinate synthase
VGSLKEQEIIFVPDRNLGAYIAKKFPEKVFILFNGFCPRHNIVNEKDVLSIKESYPGAKFLAHPECREEVLKYADYIGSTSGILDYARRSEENQFIIGTELGICQILRREMPEKTFVPVTGDIFCINMKKTKLEDVLDCLEGRRKPIEIPAEDFAGAARSLERMVAAE